MTDTFMKDTVLSNKIDFFCLVCELRLFDVEDVVIHISSEYHKRMFQESFYLKQFKDDLIRQTKMGYICELCYMFIKSLDEVIKHVNELYHNMNSQSKYVKRLSNKVVEFDDLCISSEAWEGIIDNFCVVCNIKNVGLNHILNSGHTVNLIQNLPRHEDRALYRKVHDNMLQCLTCNQVVSMLGLHFISEEHQINYENCNKNAMKLSKLQNNPLSDKFHLSHLNERTLDQRNVISSVKDNDIVCATSEHFDDSFDVIEIDVTFCILCNASNVNLRQHLNYHHARFLRILYFLWKRIKQKTVNKCNSVIVLKYEKLENSEENKAIENGLCRKNVEIKDSFKCDVTPPFTLCDIKNNVDNREHKAKLNQTQNYETESINQLIVSKERKESDNIFHLIDFAVENDYKFDIERRTAYCELCKSNISFTIKGMEGHLKMKAHKSRLFETLRETPSSESDESISTDITPETYLLKSMIEFSVSHQFSCNTIQKKAFCNICKLSISLSIFNMENHLKTDAHKSNMMIYSKLDSEKNNQTLESNKISTETVQSPSIKKEPQTDEPIFNFYQFEIPNYLKNFDEYMEHAPKQRYILKVSINILNNEIVTHPIEIDTKTPEHNLDDKEYMNMWYSDESSLEFIDDKCNSPGPETDEVQGDNDQSKTAVSQKARIWCDICKCSFKNSEKHQTDHVNGKRHKTNMALAKKNKIMIADIKNTNDQKVLQKENQRAQKTVFCEVCKCYILDTKMNWSEHITGKAHKKSLLKVENEVEDPINDSHIQNIQKDLVKPESDIKSFVVLSNNFVFCSVCKLYVSNLESSWSEHVTDCTHKLNLLLQEKRVKSINSANGEDNVILQSEKNLSSGIKNLTRKVLDTYNEMKDTVLSSYIKTYTVVKDQFIKSIILNYEICISYLSFFTITLDNSKFNCYICSVVGSIGLSMKEHVCTTKHVENSLDAPVIISNDSQFIRKIKSSYHCGFCNELFESWDSMHQHSDTIAHREAVVASKWRLHIFKQCPTVGFEIEVSEIFSSFEFD